MPKITNLTLDKKIDALSEILVQRFTGMEKELAECKQLLRDQNGRQRELSKRITTLEAHEAINQVSPSTNSPPFEKKDIAYILALVLLGLVQLLGNADLLQHILGG